MNKEFNSFINQDYNSIANFLNTLDPYEFSLVGVLVAYLVAPTLNTNQLNSVGNFLEMVGQILLTIAAQQIVVNNSSNNMNLEINKLKEEIEYLKSVIKRDS